MKTILFIDGTKGFSPHRLEEKPCGGIITSLILVPQYLAKQGHNVFVFSEYKKEEQVNKVNYINRADYRINPDIVVFNRNVFDFNLINYFKDSYKIWWLHDIVDYRYLVDGSYRNVDKIVALSQYCLDCYSDYYDIDKHCFRIIPNGVDKSVFYYHGGERNKNLFICASSTYKGVYPIEFTYLNMKRLNPNVEFRLYTSQTLHDLEESESSLKRFEHFRDIGINMVAPIPQKELAKVMREAYALLMPNHYPEICSNLLLQAQSSGLPIIATPIGSAPEFIEHGKSGLLTHTYPHDMYWWWKDYALQVATLASDVELWKFISRNSPTNVFSWEYIGEKWMELIG